MEFLSMFIIPVATAITAYSTNLLAITMLFRPHREIRVFGRRLPFTPGMIPRHQQQLAQKMGQSLADNILTSETLIDAVTNSGIVDNIVNMVQGFVGNIATSDQAASKILADMLKRDEQELVQDILQHSEKISDKLIVLAREYAEDKALPYLHSEDFARLLTDFANTSLAKAENSGKKLYDIMPKGAVDAIKAAAKDNAHRLEPMVRKFLSDDRVDTRLRQLVNKIAKENASGLLGLFVNGDKIYDSITQNLLKYLDDKQNHVLIYEKLEIFIDNMLDKELAWLVGHLKHENTENWLAAAIAALQKNLNQEHVSKIFDGISRSFAPEKVVLRMLSMSPAQIIPINADHKAAVDKLMRNATSMLVQKASEHIVGALDIAKIAEERVNAFETREMERLVKDVAGSQLKWIVRLGGLLGFIMGFFPAIFNLIFS